MKRYKRQIYAGAYIDNSGKLCINTSKDKMSRDIVLYNQNTSGITVIDGVPIVYGYQYNPKCELPRLQQFREQLKHPQNVNHLDEFVETGILRMSEQVSLDNFKVIIRVKPTRTPSVLDTMWLYLDYHSNSKFISLQLIKDTYDNVTFDYDRAVAALRRRNYDDDDIAIIINRIKSVFDEHKGSLELFEMKRFLPASIRKYFTNFLKFSTEEESQAYRALQGVNVLIYDDLLTSGATLLEAKRYLTAINPSNTLTCYVLIKQH